MNKFIYTYLHLLFQRKNVGEYKLIYNRSYTTSTIMKWMKTNQPIVSVWSKNKTLNFFKYHTSEVYSKLQGLKIDCHAKRLIFFCMSYVIAYTKEENETESHKISKPHTSSASTCLLWLIGSLYNLLQQIYMNRSTLTRSWTAVYNFLAKHGKMQFVCSTLLTVIVSCETEYNNK